MGWWPLDEGQGRTTADYSGNNDTGALSSTAPSWVPGEVGNSALRFDGVSTYVEVAAGPVLDLSSAGTVAAWVEYGSYTSTWQAIVCKADIDVDNNGYCLYTARGELCLQLSGAANNAYDYECTSASFDDGQWHHVAATWDGTSTAIYVDGQRMAGPDPQTLVPVSDVYPLNFGTTGDFTSFFSGSIDDVRVYDRALSASEVGQIFSGQ